MNKKEMFIPILVAAISLLFAGISIAVYLTGGKSKKWIARKMKIGGILLTLTAVSCNNGVEKVTCYETVATNSIWMDAHGEKGIEISLDTSSILSGRISAVQGKDFSYSLSDDKGKKIQTGLLLPTDGNFDAFDEAFRIELDKSTLPGSYQLKLYASSINSQDTVKPQDQVQLHIKKMQ